MKPEDAEMLRILVKARTGVVINPNNTYQLETSLGGVARREGCASSEELIGKIRAERDERLMWAVAEALTPSETAFFRDGSPFEAFAREMLPRFTAKRDAPVRVWSAACSTGQEAWSLAMLVEEARQSLGQTRLELYASDVSESAVAKARGGTYTQFEVQRGLPIRRLLQHFERHDESWKVGSALIQAVRWRRLSLLSDLSALGRFEVIFARNVVRYFDRPTRRKVLEQLRGLLSEDGYLVLGVGEDADDLEGLYPATSSGVYTRAPHGRAEAA